MHFQNGLSFRELGSDCKFTQNLITPTMASNYTRRINLYINGKEVKNDIASIRSEMQKLVNQQARITIGSKEYVAAAKEIRKLKTIVAEHNEDLKVTSKGWGGMQKAIGIAVAAAAGIASIGATISKFFNAYREQERAVQKVAQAIETTGNAAGLSLKTLTKEASNLQNKTLFGDEEILNKSTAQLLTFTNITGDNFLKTQRAAMDLATVLDGDLQNASIMLGKAMNDPVKGLMALRRVGVSFTEDQREQIKVLAETNRLEEAQTIILGNMTRQYGGQAEAAAKGTGVWTQVKMQLGEITEAIGGKMSTALIDMGTNFRDLFKSIAESIGGTSAVDAFDAQITSVLNLTEKIDPLLERYDELKSKSKLSKDEQAELKDIIDQVAESVPGAVSAFDEYGKAIGINTSKAREFINEQVAMMGVLNKTAIKEAKKALKELEIPLADAKRVRDTMSSSGVTEQHGLNTTTRGATQEEIKASQDKYADLANQKLGYETLIKNLNGDALKNAVAKREQDAQSAKQTEDKKTSYKKLSVSTLKKLAEDEDELAKEEIARRKNTKHGTKTLGDAFKELSKQIADFDSKINDAIAGGNSPLVEKLTLEKKAAELLLKTYNEVKSAYASGWDMNQRDQGSIDTLVGMGANIVEGDKDPNSLLQKRNTGLEVATPEEEAQAVNDRVAAEEAAAADLRDRSKEAAWEVAQLTSDTIFTIVKNRQQAEFNHAMGLLEKKRKAELDNANLTESQKAAINANYDQQAAALRKEQFKKEQNAAVIQAVINGVMAIGKTFATLGWPLGIPGAAIAAAGTIAQIAVIKSQKAPEFSEGGFTLQDKSNKKVAGVVHANEYVIPAQGVSNPKLAPFINMIEVARQNGNLPTLNAKTIVKSLGRGFEDGGFTSLSDESKDSLTYTNKKGREKILLGGPGVDIMQSKLIMKLAETVDNLTKRLDAGIESTVAIRGRNGLNEKMEEDKQSQKNASI